MEALYRQKRGGRGKWANSSSFGGRKGLSGRFPPVVGQEVPDEHSTTGRGWFTRLGASRSDSSFGLLFLLFIVPVCFWDTMLIIIM